MSDTIAATTGQAPGEPDAPASRTTSSLLWGLAGVAVVLALGGLVRFLEDQVPGWTAQSAVGDFAASVEYPVYAIAIGLLGNALLTATGLRDRLSGGFRTEFFIKTGLVLLGASINFAVIWKAAGPAIAQAVLLISAVFLFTWWLGGVFGLDDKLRALLSAAVSICGVSAAIAAAGAVRAKKEHLAYVASLVILFALPSIFLLPWLADLLDLSPAVAGAWIGGNIDTTAAVAAAGELAGPDTLKIATIVKATQNALMGVVAVALTAYFAFKIERRPAGDAVDRPARPGLGALWERFPKFVLGFIAASAIGTWYVASVTSAESKPVIGVVNDLRVWFLILAFVSIGLEFRVSALKAEGWRPIVVFGSAALANLALGLALASLLFASFTL